MEGFFTRVEKLITNNKILAATLVATFLVRLPSLFEPLWYGDEAIYLTIGQKLARGGLMYVDIFDHKTPGIYYLAAVTLKVLGESIWSFRFLLMIWVLVSLVVFYLLAKKMFNKKAALWAVILLSVLTSTPLIEGNSVNSEILMILPITLGILVGLNKKFFLSGTFFSLAFLLKFPGVFDFAAFFVFAALAINKNTIVPTLKNLLGLTAGFLLPIILTIVYFTAKGALGTYVYSAFLFNIAYTSYHNHFIIENGLLIVKAAPLVTLLIYFLVRLYSRLKEQKESGFGLYEFLIIWLVFSFYGATFGGRPYEHYLIQAVPAFSLVVVASFYRKSLAKIGAAATTVIVILTFLLGFQPFITPSYYPNFFRYLSGKFTFEQYTAGFNWHAVTNYALADFLKGCEKFNQSGDCERWRTSKGDKLYVFSNQSGIYFLSGLDPASRYITFFHIAGDEKAKKETFTEVHQSKPKYILVETPHLGPFPDLEKLLSSRYNLFAYYENMAIYQILPSTTR